MKGEIKYQNALDVTGKLININTLKKENKAGEKYTCLSCNETLIPRLGTERIHHFAHKNDNHNCSKETYLHKLGKKVFYDTYTQCLATKEPFYIETVMNIICHYKGVFNQPGCAVKAPCKFDLISRFNKIDIEKKVGNFIADIALSNDNNEVLFIEIAVTHPCEPEKIASGYQIIEIPIKEETDTNLIQGKIVSAQNPLLQFYNFENFNVFAELNCSYNAPAIFRVLFKNGTEQILQNNINAMCKWLFANREQIASFQNVRLAPSVSLPNFGRQYSSGPRIDDIERQHSRQHYYKGNSRPRKKR